MDIKGKGNFDYSKVEAGGNIEFVTFSGIVGEGKSMHTAFEDAMAKELEKSQSLQQPAKEGNSE